MFMAYLTIGLLALLGVFAMLRMYATANPASLATAVRRTALCSAILGAVLLLLRVPLGLLFLALGAALPLSLRWRSLWPRADGPAPGSRRRASRIETKYLSMVLDHDSGTLDGRVLAGRHRDRRLADLDLDQVLEVRADCQADDPEGVTLIDAYIDRIHGTAWRSAERAGDGDVPPRRPSASMTREEAYEVLGVEPGASDAEIRAAHHRLMMKVHPDQGGSNYLAAKINQAKDLLLGA